MAQDRHIQMFANYILKLLFFYENCFILIHISLFYVSNGTINDNLARVPMMASSRTGNKSLSDTNGDLIYEHIYPSLIHDHGTSVKIESAHQIWVLD